MNRACGVIAAVVLIGAARSAAAQESYPQTLYWGSGLIDIPVAWVSPVSGDFALTFSAKTITGADPSSGIGVLRGYNTNGSIAASVLGRGEVGLSIYSDNPEWGFFWRALLIDQESFRGRPGIAGWIPSIAVGMRNIGPYSKIDRFTVGYDLVPGGPGNPSRQHVADSLHQGFSTAETVYGVATKSFSLSDLSAGWPHVGISLSAGYGDGLFKDDGGLGARYARHATGGVFGGAMVDFYPTPTTTLSFLAENNAWDYNLGALLDYRGVRAGVYWTEVGAGSARDSTAGSIYNYSKFAFTLGWSSNVFALLRGNVLQRHVAELAKEKQELTTEITARQQRITTLETEISRYQAQNLLDLEQRRAQAEQELQSERAALRQLEDQLRALEQGSPPSSSPR